MNRKHLALLIILFTTIVGGTIINTNNKLDTSKLKYMQSKNKEISYNLKEPTTKIKLPDKLKEVSALSYHKNNLLACLNDERADIFLVNYQNKELNEKLQIAGKGDYEGIEIIENTAYMLKSNGQLLKITDFAYKMREITELKTPFSRKNDCEGLGYDPETQNLLIACKGSPYLAESTEHFNGQRAVYEYDINSENLNKTPKFLISLQEIEEKTGKKEFMPSGIAVHPLTHNIYIIASVGKLLIVLNRKGQIIDFEHLNKKVFRQPEGICFSPNGKKLFIANEGRKKKGNILVFEQI